jgi:gluconate 2-dehydrogenase gamma chain
MKNSGVAGAPAAGALYSNAMTDDELSRRQWLLASSLGFLPAIWPQIAAAQEHAHGAAGSGGPAGLTFLDRETAAEIEALAAQVIPTDATAGAREAGVIYFIDRALGTFDADKRDIYQKGMQEAQARRSALFPESKSIAALTPEQQIALLQDIENTEFFELLRMHTILGFLGDPRYGGNRDLSGWKLIGFEDRPGFEPPFGYYDAQASQGGGQ